MAILMFWNGVCREFWHFFLRKREFIWKDCLPQSICHRRRLSVLAAFFLYYFPNAGIISYFSFAKALD